LEFRGSNFEAVQFFRKRRRQAFLF